MCVGAEQCIAAAVGQTRGCSGCRDTASGRARVGLHQLVGQGVLARKGCSRGCILCGSHRGTCLIAAVAAAYILVAVSALATELGSLPAKYRLPAGTKKCGRASLDVSRRGTCRPVRV